MGLMCLDHYPINGPKVSLNARQNPSKGSSLLLYDHDDTLSERQHNLPLLQKTKVADNGSQEEGLVGCIVLLGKILHI